jgi:hypothetical protein
VLWVASPARMPAGFQREQRPKSNRRTTP